MVNQEEGGAADESAAMQNVVRVRGSAVVRRIWSPPKACRRARVPLSAMYLTMWKSNGNGRGRHPDPAVSSPAPASLQANSKAPPSGPAVRPIELIICDSPITVPRSCFRAELACSDRSSITTLRCDSQLLRAALAIYTHGHEVRICKGLQPQSNHRSCPGVICRGESGAAQQ